MDAVASMQATGGHDHGAHDHGSESDEKDTIMKNLVAVLGIYIFFVFESGMGLLRKYRRNKVGLCSW